MKLDKQMVRAGLTAAVLMIAPAPDIAFSASALVRNATVHTATDRGTLAQTDVLITDGSIAQIGQGLSAPADAIVIDAEGKSLTPGLFGGLTHLGIEEIGLEPSVEDFALKLDSMRPEFDVSYAFNPASTSLSVSRVGGVTFAVLAPSAEAGGRDSPDGTIIAGQGTAVLLDGVTLPSSRALFVDLGGDANDLSGGSRAAQYMLLRQAFLEARSPNQVIADDQRLLTPAGRQSLLEFIKGARPFVFEVDRAADIRQVIAFAQREKLRAVIQGGAEAWRVAAELASAKIPVILDPLENLPGSFDTVGATLENAARLHKAGVKVAFSFGDPQPHNIRKLRQAAGNAVAQGLPWEAGLAALTRHPAEIFGLADRGTIETGKQADLVLWSGDPLEVTTVAERVLIAGQDQPMRSRQTELRDRYLERLRAGAAR
jgi:imidazolonepropionase-like amidohydrolase